MKPALNSGESTQQQYLQFKEESSGWEQGDLEEQLLEEEKMECFYQCTENEEKIWMLFKSLDCPECKFMYNNKDRRPQIICANNHLLCRSCYTKIRQSTLLCPFCHVRISHKSGSSHESIQLFLKIYNQIYDQQRSILYERIKRGSGLQFELPKNIKTILFLLLIIVTPWIYDGMRWVVCLVVEMECRLVGFLYSQVGELVAVVRTVVEDQFYIGLYTNENGDYVYHGQLASGWCMGFRDERNIATESGCRNINEWGQLFTQRHRQKLATYMQMAYYLGYFGAKIGKSINLVYVTLRALSYISHFMILLVGIVQFPFVVPILLIKLQVFFPKRYIYRIGLYLDILEPDESIMEGENCLQQQDIERLTKFQLYFFVMVRNYMQWVLKVYRSVEVDMKKRCEELEYKRSMRQLKKKDTGNKTNKSSPNVKPKMRFSFN